MKYEASEEIFRAAGRSREGAWIEISIDALVADMSTGRSREGAWIEILLIIRLLIELLVAPARERGLKCWSPVTGEQTL